MTVLGIILFGFGIAISLNINGQRRINLLLVFSIVCAVITLFSVMGLYNLRQPSNRAYLMVYLGYFSYLLGYIVKYAFNSRNLKSVTVANKEDALNERFIVLVLGVCIFFEIFILLRAIPVIKTGGLRTVHRLIRQTDGTGLLRNKAEKLIDQLLILPTVYAFIPLSLTILFHKGNNSLFIFALVITEAILYVLTHAGRIILVYYAFYVLLLLQTNRKSLSNKYRLIIFISFLVIIVVFAIMTISRRGIKISDNGAINRVVKDLYDYFAIPVPMLDYWSKIVDINDFWSYGVAFFHGLLELILQLAEEIGINIEAYYRIVSLLTAPERYYVYACYNDTAFNAFVTPFFFFYSDFRWIGVALGSFIYGFISNVIEQKSMKSSSRGTTFFLLFSQSVIKAFCRWEFFIASYCISYIFVLFSFKSTEQTKRIKFK